MTNPNVIDKKGGGVVLMDVNSGVDSKIKAQLKRNCSGSGNLKKP